MSAFFSKNRNTRNSREIDPEKRTVRIIFLSAVGAVLLMLVIALITFLLTVQSKELTMVPDMRGMELANAIIRMQEKALYANVQLRFSDSMNDKGTVLEQDPKPGTLVKAGGRVLLKVSKGIAVEKLDNYVGMDVTEVENHLRSLKTSYGQLLVLKKPFIYVFNDKPAGTILEQKPLPGTEVSVNTSLSFVVSKGPEGQLTIVRDYENIPWDRALDLAVMDAYPFSFSIVDKKTGMESGVVVNQSPTSESEVPFDTVRQLFITKPDEIPQDQVFGILEKEIPVYPVAVPVTVTAVLPAGDKKVLASFKSTGGLLSVPYMEPDGTALLIAINGEDKIREVVRVQAAE